MPDKAHVCEKCGSPMERVFMGLCECTNENCGNKYDMEDEIE